MINRGGLKSVPANGNRRVCQLVSCLLMIMWSIYVLIHVFILFFVSVCFV